MYFTYTLFTDILFINSSRKTLLNFLKTPNNGNKMCEETMCNMWSCVFPCINLRIIVEICDFCLEISLKNHWNFFRLVCGNPDYGNASRVTGTTLMWRHSNVPLNFVANCEISLWRLRLISIGSPFMNIWRHHDRFSFIMGIPVMERRHWYWNRPLVICAPRTSFEINGFVFLQHFLFATLIDKQQREDLEEWKVINWHHRFCRLVPLSTKGQSHAIPRATVLSLIFWCIRVLHNATSGDTPVWLLLRAHSLN